MAKHRGQRRLQLTTGNRQLVASLLTESTRLLEAGDFAATRLRLQRDGYIFLREYLPIALVEKAYGHLAAGLQQAYPASLILRDQRLSLVPGEEHAIVGLLARQDLAAHPAVCCVLETPALASLAAQLLQVPSVKTTEFKWLRAVKEGDYTGLHTDRVFLGQNSESLLTIWLPLHEVSPEQGGMVVCSGSHRSRAFEKLRQSYGTSTVGIDGTRSGWLTPEGSRLCDILKAEGSNIHGIDWRSATFGPGDVLVLHQDLLHMTANNQTDTLRISCDTRWQPSNHDANPTLGPWREIPFEHC